jgi:hypothetical protein
VFTTKGDFLGGKARCSIGGVGYHDVLGPMAPLGQSAHVVRSSYGPAHSATLLLIPSSMQDRLADCLGQLHIIRGFQLICWLVSFQEKQSGMLDSRARAILKEYAGQFLQAGYNLLMEGLRKDLEPGLNISRLSEEDFLRFFKLAAFCTAFVRLQQVCHPDLPLSETPCWLCSGAMPHMRRDALW